MERSKYILTFILLILASDLVSASSSGIYKAYISSDMDRWKVIMDDFHRKSDKSNVETLELVNYIYGYVGWCMGNNNQKKAGEYIRTAEDYLSRLEKAGYQPSMVHAYRSAFFGFRVGLHKLQAPVLGPKSVHHARQSMESDPRNPYGYIQYANSQFYMPAIFGGSKNVALEYFQKAEQLMEMNGKNLEQNWNYLSLLSMIALTFEELKQFDEAKKYYEKILKTEPGFQWVKNVLYPAILKKPGNEK